MSRKRGRKLVEASVIILKIDTNKDIIRLDAVGEQLMIRFS